MVSSEATREAKLQTTSSSHYAKRVHITCSIIWLVSYRVLSIAPRQGTMSLFQYGFRRVSANSAAQEGENLEGTPAHMPTEESGLGRVEYDSTTTSVSELADPTPAAKKRRTRGKYTQYTPEQRAHIGKYALDNGNERARPHFLPNYPDLRESTIRNFKKAYKERMQYQRKQLHPQPVTAITAQPRGRPPILLELDEKLIKFLRAIRTKGGVINIHVVRAATKALIASNPLTSQHLVKFDMPRSWVQSIYRCMGYTKRMGTTTRPPVPQGLYDECRRAYLSDIEEKMKKHSIPPELVLNSDQTPSSYMSVGRATMAASGSSSVPIKGLTDKRNITLTFVVSLAGEFLPLQIIYGGKTAASLPRGFQFLAGFCLSQNPKHWSNEQETLKLIDEVITPYAVRKRAELQLATTQKVLVIWDVFRGQMTEEIKKKLQSLHMELVPVPANMTHFFLPLDLTVNGSAKQYMRKQFITYYSDAVKQQLDSGKQLEDVEVDFRLTTIKPLHAQWLVNMYNFFTTEKGAQIIAKGWKKAGITGLLDGSTVLPCEDPFEVYYS